MDIFILPLVVSSHEGIGILPSLTLLGVCVDCNPNVLLLLVSLSEGLGILTSLTLLNVCVDSNPNVPLSLIREAVMSVSFLSSLKLTPFCVGAGESLLNDDLLDELLVVLVLLKEPLRLL
ncbi:unnamed protein product [Meganyctiphanes norvegica]|uniref:Uncharacterized protein n=1 Tax=Meganyctiphanes norvegica TaxID=48144 RepID=A0AAV2RB17_MEGNR